MSSCHLGRLAPEYVAYLIHPANTHVRWQPATAEHAFRAAGPQICEKSAADFLPLRLSFALANGGLQRIGVKLSKHLQAENKGVISSLLTSRLHVRIPTGDPLRFVEHTGTRER